MVIESADQVIKFVAAFLDEMERRDLDAAQARLAPDAVLTFPGGVKRQSAAAVAAGSASRYRRIGKAIETWEASRQQGAWVVYCRGTLLGEWLDGTPFAGIRFIDRFEVGDNGIRRQDVWNDAGEHRTATRNT